jgi:hypothetical protein
LINCRTEIINISILTAVSAFISLIFFSCGIPSYSYLEKPVKMSSYYSATGDGVTLVGFTTPSNDTNILGYNIYYKIYSQDDSTEVEDDEKYFDENYYIDDNTEMQTGDKIPNKRGFIRIGEFNVSADSSYLNRQFSIEHPGAGIPVYIDFDPSDTDDAGGADNRDQPVIAENAPGNANKIMTIARGFRDSGNNPDDNFLSFVNDWNLESDISGSTVDGDLKRAYYLLSRQPASENISGTEIFSSYTGVDILIGFAAYSTGLDITGGTFAKIDSKPVFLGFILYPAADDTESR